MFSLKSATDSGLTVSFSITLFSFPISLAIFFWKFSSRVIALLASISASSNSSSLVWCAEASIILILPSFPQTTRSYLYLVSSSRMDFGAFTKRFSVSYLPIRTAPTGPAQGMFDTESAKDAAFIASITGSFSSTEITVTITCTAWRIDCSKSGRRVRSITREARIASSDGLPSRFTKRLPEIFPEA